MQAMQTAESCKVDSSPYRLFVDVIKYAIGYAAEPALQTDLNSFPGVLTTCKHRSFESAGCDEQP